MPFFVLSLCAQEDTLRVIRDSLQLIPKEPNEIQWMPFQLSANKYIDYPSPERISSDSSVQFFFKQPLLMIPYYTDPSPMFKGDYHTNGILFSHRHGMLTGAGSQTNLPGIGRSNDASLTYIHSVNSQWILSIGMDVNKMHMNHFTGQSFGMSGILSYLLNDRLTFNVFGGYHSGYVPGGQSYHFGGSIGMDMSEHFGMELGVQRYYNPLRGGWETVPIAAPYFRFNNGAKFGFDVGGLLYEIFRDTSFKKEMKKGHYSNPTITPPGPKIEIR